MSSRNGARRRGLLDGAGYLLLLACTIGWCGEGAVIETDSFRYAVGPDGKNAGFADKATGTDYLDRRAESLCARAERGGSSFAPSSIAMRGSTIAIEFAAAGISAELTATPRPGYCELEVTRVAGDPDAFVFLEVPLTLRAVPGEGFGACAFALNLKTNVEQLPALQNRLRATCYRRFGLVGAKVALVGVPQPRILDTLKAVILNAPELPKTTVSGPWANEIPFNHGSYLFNFGSLTEKNVDEWIAATKAVGFNQIDSHGGGAFFRFGDLELNREKWPDGWESFARIVAKLHAAGIGAIFHTYCYFIDKGSSYVTPVPRRDLDAFRAFTLAEPIAADAQEIRVVESTKDISTVTGFFVHNSVTLHVDDELVTFRGVAAGPPFAFTGCTRGAHGTRPAPHAAGARARHLKECFGLFVPDCESPLFEEIAAKHAEIVNRCDFDGIYLDAIDGSSILRGGEDAWHYAGKFLFDLWRHLKKPVGMEMSAMWHHFWQFRSRWQAWDFPSRGHKRFIDLHVQSVNGGLLLPLHLGWWNFHTYSPPQVEPTFSDTIEYLGCKLIGYDAGISLTSAIDRQSLERVPAVRELADLLKTYEDLRHARAFGEEVRKKLREPGQEFTLARVGSAGAWALRPARYRAHTVEGRTDRWEVANDLDEQPLPFCRIEALASVGPYEGPANLTVADFSTPKEFGEVVAASGVTARLEPSSDQVKAGSASGRFSARGAGTIARTASWAKAAKAFTPCADLGERQALGLWVHGDGQGELLNVRLESPFAVAYGAIGDHYVTVDFTGWRYVALVETESTRHSDYAWPEGDALYHVYREFVNFKQIETLSIWYNNLPPDKEVTCYLSPIKALPLLPCRIENPTIAINGRSVRFPVTLESGSCLVLADRFARVYGPKGELVSERVDPQFSEEGARGLERGSNTITFTCDDAGGPPPRAKVTLMSYGRPL